MLKPAITVLIVLSGLALVSWNGRVVLAESDDSVDLLGYELRVQFRAELKRGGGLPRELQLTIVEDAMVADSAEAR